eukprot:81418_1
MDVFPRFRKSDFYAQYIETKLIESRPVSVKDFRVVRYIGEGAFGTVDAVEKEDSGMVYAQKKINKKQMVAQKSVDAVLDERNFLAQMDSRFVTNLSYAFQDKDFVYLLLDYQTGGDLKYHLSRVGQFPLEQSVFYAAQILLGLDHLHSLDILYRDMKLENVLMDGEGNLRLSDLGLAKQTTSKVRGNSGTPGYTAPEVIDNLPYD